ncbi:MAG TPA: hypothetical protein VHX44_03500 [Planctomycetota bacterium]|jgi:hypothetical protein|nr:hypothetical protein [Planctomycetota bacterium]
MPKAGQPERFTFELKDPAGDPVSATSLDDLVFLAHLDGLPIDLDASDFEDRSGHTDEQGKCAVTLTMPASLGRLRVDVAYNPDPDVTVDPEVIEGRIYANDIDSVAVLAARPPSVTLAGNVSPRSAFSITVYKGDGRTIRIPIYDDDGNLVDLTLWQNFRFSIQNSLQVASGSDLPYHQTTGITGGADGFLVVELPEDCSAYAVHPAGHKKTTLYHSCDANLITDTTAKTRTLRAGPFIILSKETPSP